MKGRCLVPLAVIAIVSVVMGAASAQGQTAPAESSTPSKTAWGDPDLQGIWDFRTVTPLERPMELSDKEFFTEQEAETSASQRVLESDVDLQRETTVTDRGNVNGTVETVDLRGAYNNFWYDRGTDVIGTRRTSLVIDPTDGKIPSLTAEAQQRLDAKMKVQEGLGEGPEDFPLSERCITGFNSGPPMVPGGYNQNVQLFQTPDHVVILNEMVHNARIVPLDGRPHGEIPQWTGESRGRWEGDTLVVETTNFLRETSFRNSSANLQLVERFRRVDADTLLYEFTVDDPTTWTSAWTAQIPMKRTDIPMFEYACHEGNYGMFGSLSGARAVERDAAQNQED